MTATSTSYRLNLPWGFRPLHANQRWAHWAQEAKVKREVRETAHLLAQSARLPRACSFADITLTWCPPSRRPTDSENIAPTLKACVDGIVGGYGLTPDDSSRYVQTHCRIGPVVKGGSMWLDIEVTHA